MSSKPKQSAAKKTTAAGPKSPAMPKSGTASSTIKKSAVPPKSSTKALVGPGPGPPGSRMNGSTTTSTSNNVRSGGDSRTQSSSMLQKAMIGAPSNTGKAVTAAKQSNTVVKPKSASAKAKASPLDFTGRSLSPAGDRTLKVTGTSSKTTKVIAKSSTVTSVTSSQTMLTKSNVTTTAKSTNINSQANIVTVNERKGGGSTSINRSSKLKVGPGMIPAVSISNDTNDSKADSGTDIRAAPTTYPSNYNVLIGGPSTVESIMDHEHLRPTTGGETNDTQIVDRSSKEGSVLETALRQMYQKWGGQPSDANLGGGKDNDSTADRKSEDVNENTSNEVKQLEQISETQVSTNQNQSTSQLPASQESNISSDHDVPLPTPNVNYVTNTNRPTSSSITITITKQDLNVKPLPPQYDDDSPRAKELRDRLEDIRKGEMNVLKKMKEKVEVHVIQSQKQKVHYMNNMGVTQSQKQSQSQTQVHYMNNMGEETQMFEMGPSSRGNSTVDNDSSKQQQTQQSLSLNSTNDNSTTAASASQMIEKLQRIDRMEREILLKLDEYSMKVRRNELMSMDNTTGQQLSPLNSNLNNNNDLNSNTQTTNASAISDIDFDNVCKLRMALRSLSEEFDVQLKNTKFAFNSSNNDIYSSLMKIKERVTSELSGPPLGDQDYTVRERLWLNADIKKNKRNSFTKQLIESPDLDLDTKLSVIAQNVNKVGPVNNGNATIIPNKKMIDNIVTDSFNTNRPSTMVQNLNNDIRSASQKLAQPDTSLNINAALNDIQRQSNINYSTNQQNQTVQTSSNNNRLNLNQNLNLQAINNANIGSEDTRTSLLSSDQQLDNVTDRDSNARLPGLVEGIDYPKTRESSGFIGNYSTDINTIGLLNENTRDSDGKLMYQGRIIQQGKDFMKGPVEVVHAWQPNNYYYREGLPSGKMRELEKLLNRLSCGICGGEGILCCGKVQF